MSRCSLVCLAGLAGLPMLVACSSPPPVPDDHYYRLAESRIEQHFQQPVLPGVVLIKTPRAAGIWRNRKMIYSDDAGHLRFEQYHYHQWEDSPPDLLRRRLADVIDQSGVARGVVRQRRGKIDFVLESRLGRFDRLIAGASAQVQVEIEVWLSRFDDPDQILLHQQYTEQAPAAAANMEATVQAFSAALDRISRRLLTDLEQLSP